MDFETLLFLRNVFYLKFHLKKIKFMAICTSSLRQICDEFEMEFFCNEKHI